MLRSFHKTIVLAAPAVLFPSPAIAQSPRQANPERPTFATHAYAVVPGYVELEQGLAARGVGSLREETSWDVTLKLGVSRSEELTSELQSPYDLVCRLLLEKKKKHINNDRTHLSTPVSE